MEFEQIIQLIRAVSDSELTSFQYEEQGTKLKMKCGKIQAIAAAGVDIPVQTAVRAAVSAAEPSVSGGTSGGDAGAGKEGNLVKSPLVGTFYATPSEDAEPFVSVGDTVKKGQILAIVEAMKLMNEIESDFDGTVAEVFVKSGEAVEYGQPLFRIS